MIHVNTSGIERPDSVAFEPVYHSLQTVIRYPDIIHARLSDRNDTFLQPHILNNFVHTSIRSRFHPVALSEPG